jgi:hypothetical protein
VFNKYFLSVAEDIIHDIKKNVNNTEDPEYYMSKSCKNSSPSIKFKTTSSKEVEKIIKSLRLRNKHGYDGISTKILKASGPFISSPLSHICNKTITSGIFPN